MKLNHLCDNYGARQQSTRVGRGIGSGKGKTCGRGHKGQKARSGVTINGFEGGQTSLFKRLPKRGFTSRNRKEFQVVNVGRLQQAIDRQKLDPKKQITVETLKEAGIVGKVVDGVRLLAKGELNTSIDIKVTGASKAAVEAVEQQGGTVTIEDRRSRHDSAVTPKKVSIPARTAERHPTAMSRESIIRATYKLRNEILAQQETTDTSKQAAKLVRAFIQKIEKGLRPDTVQLGKLARALRDCSTPPLKADYLADLLSSQLPSLSAKATEHATICIVRLNAPSRWPRVEDKAFWESASEILTRKLEKLGA